MRKLFLLGLTLFSVCSFGQDIKATTEDGKKVILKVDKTWKYDDNQVQDKRKITLEFIHKDPKRQFQVVYDAPDNNIVDSGSMIGGFYNSGWKKSFYVTKMENQVTLKVGNMRLGAEMITLNIYIDDKLVKTVTEKAKNLGQRPATLTINLEDYE
jgi:hypothetical protein